MKRLLPALAALALSASATAAAPPNKGHKVDEAAPPKKGHKVEAPEAAPPKKGHAVESPEAAAPHKGGPVAVPVMPSGEVPDRKLFPFPIEEHALANGLKVLFVPYDSPGLTAYYSLVRTGSRNEVEQGKSGFAHFFEHMMFRGTDKHPKSEYDELLSRAGVSNNAFTTDDFTTYTVFGPSKALPLIVDLESDRFQNLKYSREDFQTEARAVLGEYNKNFSNPSEKMEEVLRDTAYTTHTYKHTTIGFGDDVKGMPALYEYSLEFFKRWYTPDNVTLILVGDFDKAATLDLISKAYGAWSSHASGLAIPMEPKQTQGKAVHVTWSNPTQGRLMLGWHTPQARIDARDAAIQNVLGPYLFGPTSPTYKDLVLDRQIASGMDVWYYDHRDPSLFYLLATVKGDESLPAVRDELLRAVAELRDGKVDAKRLADVKSNQKYSLLKQLDTAPNVAQALAFAIGATGETSALNALFNQMDALTADDLVKFTKLHLVDDNLTEVALTGKGGTPPKGVAEYVPGKEAKPPAPEPSQPPKKGQPKSNGGAK